MKKPTGKSTILHLAMIICLLFVIGSTLFVSFVRSRTIEQSLRTLGNATEQVSAAVTQQILGDLQLLRGVAASFSESFSEDRESINRRLASINYSNTFLRMGIFSRKGVGDVVDLSGKIYMDIDVSEFDFYDRVMEGDVFITPVVADPITGDPVNIYAVPMQRRDFVTGVLAAVNASSVLERIIDQHVYQDEGFYQIIDETGRIIGAETDKRPLPEDERLCSLLEFRNDGEYEALLGAVARDEASHHTAYLNGVKQTVVAHPVDVNHWAIVAIIPAGATDIYYNQVFVGTLVIMIVACFIFLFLLVYQRRTMLSSQKNLEWLAYTDTVTRHINYTKFKLDVAQRLVNSPREYLMWNFDIKQFKRINDTLGYQSADQLLQAISELIQSRMPPGGLFCRISADDFTGFGPNNADDSAWIERVQSGLNEIPLLKEARLLIEIKVGFVHIAPPDCALSVTELVNRASIAKQCAKDLVGVSYAVYDANMAARIHRESTLEQSAPAALKDGEFTFFMQPKVSISGGQYRFIGAEALARWITPDGAMVSPGEFIPLFEKNGFIVQLDRHIFRQVCRWYKERLRQEGHALHFSINVSRLSFLQEDFIEYYASVKREFDIPDHALELELTESIVMDNYASHYDTVRALEDRGFICSIDDFGSGYSSLNVLKELPMEVIKLDAAFFRPSGSPERGRIVVRNFIRMAKDLDITTVAEGVEEKSQVDFLQEIGCDIIQGYIFSKPLPLADFEKYMHEYEHTPIRLSR